MRVSKLMIVLGLTALYLLFTLAFPMDSFIDFDPNSTFAAQLMRKRLEGDGTRLISPTYNKENVNKPFIASDDETNNVPIPELIRYGYSNDTVRSFVPVDGIGGSQDTRYNTDNVTRVFNPSNYREPKYNYQPNYVYYKDNLSQLYSTIILGPVIIVLCYILFSAR